MELTRYEITYEDNTTSSTSMASHMTLQMAKNYFIGKLFNLGVFPVENMVKAVKVKSLN